MITLGLEVFIEPVFEKQGELGNIVKGKIYGLQHGKFDSLLRVFFIKICLLSRIIFNTVLLRKSRFFTQVLLQTLQLFHSANTVCITGNESV